MGSKWVDESFGFMLGWNFFLYGELDKIYSGALSQSRFRGGLYSVGNQCLKFGVDLLER